MLSYERCIAPFATTGAAWHLLSFTNAALSESLCHLLIATMNTVILVVTSLIGLVLAGLFFRYSRSRLASLVIPFALVAIVWICLRPANELPGEANAEVQMAQDPQQDSVPNANNAALQFKDLERFRPIEVAADGYVGSDACKECHQENHSSWFASYHRTMTQLATPDNIMGDFNNVEVQYRGDVYRLQNEGGLCVVDMPDLGNPDPTARVQSAVVMSTGSHHMQLYWFVTLADRMVGMLPLAYLRETKEWVPRSATFLQPQPNDSFEMARWNVTCSKCHATHRRGRLTSDDRWDTHVGEFGISCEACHGPGEPHLRFRKEMLGADSTLQDPISNPSSLTKERSAEACGQCHAAVGVRHFNDDTNMNGHGFVPGAVLDETYRVGRRDAPESTEEDELSLMPILNDRFYLDGMIRVSGREYNGLTQSACYLNGEMTCLSCHQMHKATSDPRSLEEWADDMLHPDALGDQACVQCHQKDEYGEQHTHHAAGSSGSSCYNCHMPHTTYGLLKAIRSHTISSPDIDKDERADRPNACNLCHLDQTLAWSASHLEKWYKLKPPDLDPDSNSIAASVLWMMRGNAAKRALVAWSMGWNDAKTVSGTDWQAAYLAPLLNDQYEAIRLIARRSLRSLPGFESLSLDVINASTTESRAIAVSQLLQYWSQRNGAKGINRPELLIKQSQLDIEALDRLFLQRDNRPIILAE